MADNLHEIIDALLDKINTLNGLIEIYRKRLDNAYSVIADYKNIEATVDKELEKMVLDTHKDEMSKIPCEVKK